MNKSFVLKYRPQSFSEIVEQENAIQLVKGYLESNCVMPVLITGPYGCGKTTISRILAAALLDCSAEIVSDHIDTIAIDGANTSVNELREKLKLAQYKPIQAKKKVFFIDEVHALSPAGFNSFLNELEFIPYNVHFILATNEIDKVPENIISRCFIIEVNAISDEAMLQRLTKIAKKNSYEVSEEILSVIIFAANGSLRDGLKYLEQCYITNIRTCDAAATLLNVLSPDLLNYLTQSFQLLDWNNLKKAINLIKISPPNALKCLIYKFQKDCSPEEWTPVVYSLVESFEIIRNGMHGKILLEIILYKAMYIRSLTLGEENIQKIREQAIKKIIDQLN